MSNSNSKLLLKHVYKSKVEADYCSLNSSVALDHLACWRLGLGSIPCSVVNFEGLIINCGHSFLVSHSAARLQSRGGVRRETRVLPEGSSRVLVSRLVLFTHELTRGGRMLSMGPCQPECTRKELATTCSQSNRTHVSRCR